MRRPAAAGPRPCRTSGTPWRSVLIRSAALRAPGLVATVLSAAVHEGERATGAWHAEWSPLRELLHLAGGATALTADVLEGLEVREQAMADRVTGAGSVMFAESVSRALSGALGRADAQDVVAAAARSRRADRHAVPRGPARPTPASPRTWTPPRSRPASTRAPTSGPPRTWSP